MSSKIILFSSLWADSTEANHSIDSIKITSQSMTLKLLQSLLLGTQSHSDSDRGVLEVSLSGEGSYQLGGRSKVGSAISVTTELRILPPLTSLLHVIRSLKQRSYLSGRRVQQLSGFPDHRSHEWWTSSCVARGRHNWAGISICLSPSLMAFPRRGH